MSAGETYYDILEVSPGSEPEVIEAAYRALIKKYHPDTGHGAGLHARATRLNEAYRVLRDPVNRAEYDSELRAGGVEFPGDAATPVSTIQPSNNGVKLWPWVIGGVVVFLIWAANQPSSPSYPSNSTPSAALANPVAAASPLPDPPASVDDAAAHRGARHFRMAVDAEGIGGAQIYSVNCYAALGRTFSWQKADQCGTFDAVTAVGLSHEPSLSGNENPYFADDAIKSRFVEAVQRATGNSEAIDHHYSLVKAAAVLDWRPAVAASAIGGGDPTAATPVGSTAGTVATSQTNASDSWLDDTPTGE